MRIDSTRRRSRSAPDELDGLLVAQAQAQAQAGDGLYGRTSSEEQAEKGTIKNQQEYLGDRARLEHWPVAGEYWDDGVSGTIPLQDREAGRRLLEDAKAGRLRRVVVYNLTRLGRTLRVILDAYDQLQAYGVEVVSATEPIDTSNPIGKFIFQLLASLAELDRATTLDKLSGGRDRVAREGRWTGGPVPFGLDVHPEDVDRDGAPRLVPSERLLPQLGQTEREAAAGLFRAIAEGASTTEEARRLNALGVNSSTRYAGQDAPSRFTLWSTRRLGDLLHNPIYMGEHTVNSQRGEIRRTFPALVDPSLWRRVQEALAEHRVSPRPERITASSYLLRGLVYCANCGGRYAGADFTPRRTGATYTYYRCTKQHSPDGSAPGGGGRCVGKLMPAPWLEAQVWEKTRTLVLDDAETLDALRESVRQRSAESAARQAQIQAHEARLTALSAERDKVLTLFRRASGRLPELLDATERQLEEIARDEADARGALATLRAQDEVTHEAEARLASAGALLVRLQAEVAWIDAHPDHPDARTKKRGVLEQLVVAVRITTEGAGRAKTAGADMESAFAAAAALGGEGVCPPRNQGVKCILPIAAVRYPAPANAAGSVSASAGMRIPALPRMPKEIGVRPVM